jgi:uncharacterized protein (TIGR00661 family)
MTKINRNHAPGEKQRSKPRILVAPLDWGLGHATRCIPVIYELLAQDADIWLAGEGSQQALLAAEFPQLPFLPLEGYRVKYSRSARLSLKMIAQFPRLFKIVKKEHEWLKKAVEEYAFDGIIADNRFGLYHSSVPSVFITHQLSIQSSFGIWSEKILQKLNYRFINRFSRCWIPDQEEGNSLAGKLSHPDKKPRIPVYYTGILSRLNRTNSTEEKGHLFISLSGPEPQRSVFENALIDQISRHKGSVTFVRGLPEAGSFIPSTNNIQFYNHLSSGEYNREMQRAEYVIARSGYSTVMDLARLGKKSILVPTPGQTEQEYLATHLRQLQMACISNQRDFLLDDMLKKAATFDYRLPSTDTESRLPQTVSSFLASLI